MVVRLIQSDKPVSKNYSRTFTLLLGFVAFDLCVTNNTLAQSSALTEIRQSRLRDLDAHCPVPTPASLEAWQARAADLKMQVQVALGLHPMPTLSQEPATIHGRRLMDGYSIEKVYFESLPGFFVTGSLYRPA